MPRAPRGSVRLYVTVKGDHKPGFAEMKAYYMLNERMDRFCQTPAFDGETHAPDAGPTFRSFNRRHNGELNQTVGWHMNAYHCSSQLHTNPMEIA